MKYVSYTRVALFCVCTAITSLSQAQPTTTQHDLDGVYKGLLRLYSNSGNTNNFNNQFETCRYEVKATLNGSAISWEMTPTLNNENCKAEHSRQSSIKNTPLSINSNYHSKSISFRIPLFVWGPKTDVSLYQVKNNEFSNYHLRYTDQHGNSYTGSTHLYKTTQNLNNIN